MPKILSLTILALLLFGCKPTGQTNEEPMKQAEQEAAPMTDREDEATSDSADPLTGTRWRVEDIAGGGVIDRALVTMDFVEPGRVAGSGGCNRYMGGYERDGGSLGFGALATTMMACPEALMNQDDRFHQAMKQVTAWRIDDATGLLHLMDASGTTVVRASPLAEGEASDAG